MGRKKIKILLTGAEGYIGRNIKEQLEEEYTIYTPSHKDVDLLNTESVDKYFKKNSFDIVVHTAIVGGSRPEEKVDTALHQNLRIFFNIIKNKKSFNKMIHFGSGAEYDKKRPLDKIREKDFDKKVPLDEYGFFKYVSSKYIEKSDNIIHLRIFGLFGKYEDYRYRFISNAICRNIFGLQITISQDVYFDYVYINDFVRIVKYFIEHKSKEKFYNIGTGKAINIFKIAKKINTLGQKKSKIIIKKRGLANTYSCNSSRLLKELGRFKFTDFDTSLCELYQWYQENKSIIDVRSL